MHVVRVILTIAEESRDTFQEIARREFEKVPQRFEGCHRFAYWQSLTNPGEVLLYEEWESAEAFRVYRDSEYFKELGSQLFPLLSGKPDSAYYDAQKVN